MPTSDLPIDTITYKFPEDHYIIDVGMNDGKDTEYYAKRGFKVIAFEANPILVDEAVKYFAPRVSSVEIRNRAISNTPGSLKFFVNRFNHAWSSLDQKLGNRRDGAEEITVTSCDLTNELETVCDRIHYVKIDIEGYDSIALEQVLRLPVLPKYVSVENGNIQMLGALDAAGYTRFKFSNQRYVPAQTIKPNSVHGHPTEHQFKMSSSGVFGEDILGRWLSYDEAMAVNEGLGHGRRVAPNNLWAESVGWFDLHAALPAA